MDDPKAKLSIEERLDRLEAQNRYLSDYLAIWKLQSLYCHYINIGAVQAIVGLFADDPGVEIELSNKGILRVVQSRHHQLSGRQADRGRMVLGLRGRACRRAVGARLSQPVQARPSEPLRPAAAASLQPWQALTSQRWPV